MAVSVSCSSHQQTMGGGGVGEGSNPSLFLSLLDGVRRSSQIWRLVRASPYSNSSPPSLASNYKDEEEGSKEALPHPSYHVAASLGSSQLSAAKVIVYKQPQDWHKKASLSLSPPGPSPARVMERGVGGYP